MTDNEDYKQRIQRDPKIMMGKPVIKGTRITVEIILRMLGNRYSIDDILEAYPHLSVDDIHAAQAFQRSLPSSS